VISSTHFLLVKTKPYKLVQNRTEKETEGHIGILNKKREPTRAS